MGPDPRGSPSDEEYIKHLEFFNEQRQKRIDELEKARGETRVWKKILFKAFVRLMRAGE